MRAYFLIIILLFPQLLMAGELADLQSANFLLKSELQLAKGAKLYMLIDLHGQAILFKAGGVVVNRLPFSASHVVGTVPVTVLRTLGAKKAEKQPKRQEVKIVTEAEMAAAPTPAPGVDTLVALEIDDMPEIYQLVLDDGLVLSVKAPPTGDFKTKATRYWRDAVETVMEWYHSMLLKLHDETEAPRIVLNLSGPDARQFYWSFDEGMPCLIKD
jgi:hypothetical protein